MRVLLIGRWGKTHALAKALARSRDIELYAIMDKKNNGIADLAQHYELGDIKDINVIEEFAGKHRIELIVVVPAASLEKDITTYFNKKGIPAVGPSQFCTKLEGDKGFLRNLMRENDIYAYPEFKVFFNPEKASQYIKEFPGKVVVKPAGITEGDGVQVEGIQLKDKAEAVAYVQDIFDNAIGGLPSVIIEDRLIGEEYTIQFFCDGKTAVPMPATRDYKLLNEGESGLNTPGMGSYSGPVNMLPFLDQKSFDESQKIIDDILYAMIEKFNEPFKGFLSGQFILTEDGVKLIEINVRPGDSEILNITPILKTDFLAICKAIHAGTLDELDIEYEKMATVCKYKVPRGFPLPKENVKITLDRKKIDHSDIHLFQSCFEVGKDLYEPSPRLFAITGVGETLEEANAQCEAGLSGIHGEGIFHRRDIGTAKLTEGYKKYGRFRGEEETTAAGIA
ncbi:MAG: phosphoribosylamine--glycine ligase [Bacteroidales bacterium]|nr:phosphoribosylamine--glycine ligase [Bacteroidales bacterium]MCF8344853.1 phosphoribosylamine--glycine ligase [Bacteroidales bacterium]MCF8350813.1 phosphoribosylamine--glycine ligase [Bacteroidales bacterium]MCF8374798.1 phosphoribosylamine--glycine ligase [Bacteroidales bacterium]MCF8399798.1 phosphoribosylamine--glycine ligase [Bacteroidales bacterium]